MGSSPPVPWLVEPKSYWLCSSCATYFACIVWRGWPTGSDVSAIDDEDVGSLGDAAIVNDVAAADATCVVGTATGVAKVA